MHKFYFVFASLCVFIGGCRNEATTTAPIKPAASNRVVLYCSVDEVFARPIINDLQVRTGLKIDVLYDTEAAKTAGLASRIRAESSRPQADVFWSSALLQTLLLNREKLLQPYVSPAARDVPASLKDASGAWTAMGIRLHAIGWKKGTKYPPTGIKGLLWPQMKNKIGMANPQFGTSSDWVAAMAARDGTAKTLNSFRALKKNGVQILPGNSVVAQRVARGELLAGIADSDDWLAQKVDFNNYGFAVPGSVAILKNAPHSANAKKLVDALISKQTEDLLIKTMPGVSSTRPIVIGKEDYVSGATLDPREVHNRFLKAIPNDTARWPDGWDKVREPLAQILLRD